VSGGVVGWDLGWWRRGLASSLLGCFSLSAIEIGVERKRNGTVLRREEKGCRWKPEPPRVVFFSL